MRLQLIVKALILGALLAAAPAYADGTVSARGVYYKEKATRVIQPMLDGMFEVGTRGTLNAHFLVDAITSASQSAGAANADAFTETRIEGGGAYTHLVDGVLDGLRIGGSTRYSSEPDYKSLFVGGRGEVDLAEKNTTLGLGVGYGRDAISGGAEGGLGQIMLQCKPGEAEAPECLLETYSLFASGSQLLSKYAVLGVTYDVTLMRGYQSNPYRSAIVGMNTEREAHPTTRDRHAVAVAGRYYFAQTDTAVIAQYRYYRDNWLRQGKVGAGAHTPEIRVIQQIGDTVDASLRYRFHTQLAAFFYKERYEMTPMNGFISDDVKLSAFRSHTVEAKLGILGEAFGLTGRWSAVRFEGILMYIAQDNRFGNAFVFHGAVTVPFEY